MTFIDGLDAAIADLPGYRKGQIYKDVFRHAYENWNQATDLPKNLRGRLTETIPLSIDAKLFFSKDGHTVKALIALADDEYIETVLMKSQKRNTVCVSTQVGCPLGCVFCASGTSYSRNLTIGEIVEQILLFQRMLKTDNANVTNIVFMGTGEPFLNYDNVIGAIRLLHQGNTFNLSMRRFSVSTAGYIPGIRKLSKEPSLDVNLAVSLHSAIDAKRDILAPINKKYPLPQLAKALRQYFQRTKRKVMFEYTLVKDTNISEEDAAALRSFINSVEAAYVVNLIPLNQTHAKYKAPSGYEISKFKEYLDKRKINYVQRYSFGGDIHAACGQLTIRT